MFAYGPADATAIPKPHHLLPHLNPDWFYLSDTGLPRGPIYKISYDLSYDYRKFIVRSTYGSDLKRAEISLRNIVS